MQFKLLPHKYQRVANWILVAGVVLAVLRYVVILTAASSSLASFFRSDVCDFVITLGLFASFMFLAFSREKVEDEFIASCRLKSVAVMAIASVCIILLLDLVQTFLTGASYQALKEWRQSFFWSGNYQIWLLLIYVVVFKLLVKRFSIDDEDEEQY